MARFRAYSSFFEFDFDLSQAISAQTHASLETGANRSFLGQIYPDVVSLEYGQFNTRTTYFGGTGLAYGSDGHLTGGTVTAFSEFSAPLNTLTSPHYAIQGISVSAAAIGDAQLTASNEDDLQVLATAFSGNDTFLLSSQDDIASAYAGNDVMYGYDGGDLLNGGDGNDRLVGGEGFDQLEGGNGNDFLIGGAGIDTASYQYADAAVTVSLRIAVAQDTGGAGIDVLKGFERLYGSAFNDSLTGNAYANEIVGLDGDDAIYGKSGDDLLWGGSGLDRLFGGAGADSFSFFGFQSGDAIDIVGDFRHIQNDKILLSKLTFGGVSGESGDTLTADQFYAAAGATAAHDASDRIIYNTSTGALYYDADGAGGEAAVQFATIGETAHQALVSGDFVLSF